MKTLFLILMVLFIGISSSADYGPITMREGANITLDGGYIKDFQSDPLLNPMQINTSQAFSSITMDADANITLDGGYIINTSLNPGIVTVGDGAEFDIDIGDYIADEQGEAITDAVDLLMSRYDNRGGTIWIAPCEIDNSGSADEIYINHASAYGASLRIEGSGVGWYDGGTHIIAPGGIVIGEFAYASDGVFIDGIYLIGNSTEPSGVGISCNATTPKINIQNTRVEYFDYGINLTSWYHGYVKQVKVDKCDLGGIYVDGNSNVIEATVDQDPHCSDEYGVYLSGSSIGNTVEVDIGIAGEDAGSKGLWVAGDANTLTCWIEPIDTEGDRVYITGESNRLFMTGGDGTAPYGKINLSGGGHNFIDPRYVTDLMLCNITFYASYYNNIVMYPSVQTASKGVLSVTAGQCLDYRGFQRSNAPDGDYWYRGAVVWNTLAATGSPAYWVCTSTGTAPGNFVASANL